MTLRHREKIEELYKRIRFPEAIDWWASCYAMDELDVMISNARHLDPIRKEIENEVWRRIVPSGGLVLDLACGRGFFSWRVHKALEGKARIIGVDLSETILRAAHDQYRHIDFVIGDAEQMPFKSDIFTNVLVISSLEHMENPRHAIKEIYRVLKPGGSLFICLHKPFIDPLVVPSMLRKLLRFARCGGTRETSDEGKIGYKGSLKELRSNLRVWLSEIGFVQEESRPLLYQFEWSIYKRFMPWAIPNLIRMGQWLNRLPLSYYKNLEYWLWRKL